MGDRPLSALIIGLGVMGSYHLRVLSGLPMVQVVGVVEPDEERLEHALQNHENLRSHAYADLDSALNATSPDLVALAVPVGMLPSLALRCIDAGVAVMIEKPLAPTEELALEIVHATEAKGAFVAVGHVERFNPAVVALKRKLDADLLGEIYQLHARRLSPYPTRKSMVGVALDLATHDVDVMRYLSGADVERVYAETEQRTHDVAEDLVCATVRFTNEATGLLEVNWLTPTKVRELSVTGARGMLVVDYLTQDLRFYARAAVETRWEALETLRGSAEGDMTRYALERREPLQMQWESFIAALRAGEPPPVTVRDGLAALSIARALQRSGELHTTIVPGYRALELPA